jgi:hypothetical protein
MGVKRWEMPDGLRQRIEPLLPKKQRRFRYVGRKPLDDRKVLQGILFVPTPGSAGSTSRRSSASAAG